MQQPSYKYIDRRRPSVAGQVSAINQKETLYNKIKVGGKTLSDDAFFDVDYYLKPTNRPFDKDKVLKAIAARDLKTLRRISEYFFNKSGIYERLCKYMAYMYKYDYFVTPVIRDTSLAEKKIIEGWYTSCLLLENCQIKKQLGKIALKVIKNGCYYGYKQEQKMQVFLQELPVDYCRSRYNWNGNPAVEFNVRYFDDVISDVDYRVRVLKLFPKEIQQAYIKYKNGKLPKDVMSDETGWVLLDPTKTVKFNVSDNDFPMFISIVPHLLDLEDAQEIDNQKMKQQLLRIIIQKFPLDKNNDLVFDIDEMNAFHNMAVNMIGDAIGVDVLSTLADVHVEDMSDNNNVSAVDQLEKVERTVYNEGGVSQMQFNSDGNIALDKSIGNDEATMRDLLLQFEDYLQGILRPLNKNPKRLYYAVDILPTTIYNFKDYAQAYKDLTMLGYSKLLPAVALGQKQTTVIAAAIFENKTMKLDEVFIAPRMSSTMTSDSGKEEDGEVGEQPGASSGSEGGRPELPDDEKSEKTIQNRESM